MKPEWCPHDLWEIADDLVENYGFHDVREQTNITDVWAVEDELHRQAIARALLDAHQRGRREGMEEAAEIARCAFDDRPRRDSMDWNDGFDDGTKAAEYAIRAKAQKVSL